MLSTRVTHRYTQQFQSGRCAFLFSSGKTLESSFNIYFKIWGKLWYISSKWNNQGEINFRVLIAILGSLATLFEIKMIYNIEASFFIRAKAL